MGKDQILQGFSRRGFLQTSAAAGLTVLAARVPAAYAAGSDRLRVGVIGCGGRGIGAALDCVRSSDGVEIVALCDLFTDRIESGQQRLREELKDRYDTLVKVTPERCFSGFEGYRKLVALPEVDLVIMVTPPHFRPIHLEAAVAAGKHVFMEKPVAVDPVGYRQVIAASQAAREKGLCIGAGTQRRHQNHYREVMRRIHDGAIGDIVSAQCYWNMGGLWESPAEHNWQQYQAGKYNELEWQCRTWLFFTWLSGDQPTEQHVHNIDVINWAMQATPVKCMGMGGRQVRTDPKYGNVFDHFAVDYEYADGQHLTSMCRQTPGCANRVSEYLFGTKGKAYFDGRTAFIEGENAYKYDGADPNPYVQEHTDLVAAIRAGKEFNEGVEVARSTLTGIMGRMSAYTGRELSWDWVEHRSELKLGPAQYQFGNLPVDAVAVPGQTKLV